MERLTEISASGNAYYPKCFEKPCCGMGECLDDKCDLIYQACKKLAAYEDIGTPEELKELKENGAFTGLELAQIAKMQKEWKAYKDAEEQGLLVRLPCKVGDTVYVQTRNFISELRITLVSVDTSDMSMYFSWMLNSGIYPNLDGFSGYELGKFVFLTREEAEKKLEEMKNK